MAIFPVTNDDVEFFTVLVNPKRSYVSSSTGGITGSLRLFARGSNIEKETLPLENFSASYSKDENLESLRISVVNKAKSLQVSGSFAGGLQTYLTKVNDQSSSTKKQKEIVVNRFIPSPSFTSNTIRKWNVKDILVPYYSNEYPTAGWGYTNYNSINFFTATGIITSSVLLYPSIENSALPEHAGYVSGTYALSGPFSFDLRINPRYKQDSIDSGRFKAGTIFHLSSSYALSLVTGSKKDANGLPVGFRLQLQLSHSADIPPSRAIPGSYPNDLIFLSEDNSLSYNNWHRVVVRWGTNTINEGTGSFNVDGIDVGTFVVPSGTIMPKTYTSKDDPRVLCVGNYYEGNNFDSSSQSLFFSDVVAEREGLEELLDTSGMYDYPASYAFNHPLKAEVHELTIRRNYMSDNDILQTSGSGLASTNTSSIAFYSPPFFTKSSPTRKYIGGHGGILVTPFQEVDGTTDDPFNVSMAFSVAGHYINLENFTKDFANMVYPRLHHLTGAAIDYTTSAEPANNILYRSSFVKKRNLTILPCDQGGFYPNYDWISSEDSTKYLDQFGRVDKSVINLDNLLSTSSLLVSKTHDPSGSTFVDELIGFSPENPGLPPGPAFSKYSATSGSVSGSPLTIFQRLKDPSSDQVTFFDISNLFYGSRILPKSFTLTDASLSGSGGRVSITIKDDGAGNLYRADSLTPHAKTNSVGNIFYSEGVVVIKSPHLYFFGKEGYEMSFRGEQRLHSSKYEILAPSGLLNSSSNSSYALVQNSISASNDPNDTETFVYISNVNFHDENLNVVAKAQLAQPALKRESEKILFKIAFDF
jgi:hypothetical protein